MAVGVHRVPEGGVQFPRTGIGLPGWSTNLIKGVFARMERYTLHQASTSEDDRGGWDGITLAVFGVEWSERAADRAEKMEQIKGVLLSYVGDMPGVIDDIVDFTTPRRVAGTGGGKYDLKVRFANQAAARAVLVKHEQIRRTHGLSLGEFLLPHLLSQKKAVREIMMRLRRKATVENEKVWWDMRGVNLMKNDSFVLSNEEGSGQRLVNPGRWVRVMDLETLSTEVAEWETRVNGVPMTH